ncbi:MAG: DUF2214 family protein [Proteobacteria bacterium]|nr:DUF2214 family protein [Pseudomonadota bacterium]
MLEPILAFLHISAFIGWIVFATAQSAICRAAWFNAASVPRLVRLDRILWIATAFVLLTGLARTWLGSKGFGWYWSNPLLYAKFGLFMAAAWLQIGPTRAYRRWQRALDGGGALPSEAEINRARKPIMLGTHLVAVIPLPAVFLARGWGAW